ncbi:hypothetical protein ACE6H2_014252 [Prunus campanulata]
MRNITTSCCGCRGCRGQNSTNSCHNNHLTILNRSFTLLILSLVFVPKAAHITYSTFISLQNFTSVMIN